MSNETPAEVLAQKIVDVQPFTDDNDATRIWQLFKTEEMAVDFVALIIREARRLSRALAAGKVANPWTDEQCIEFACVAFRHAPKNLPKGVTLDDIRLGAQRIGHMVPQKVTRENEQAVMRDLADFIASSSYPEDPRLEVAYAIARHLDLGWTAANAAPPADPAKASEPDLHPKTADLVNRFARALAEKLAAAEKKYGYSDGWSDPGWLDECRAHLIAHVRKGDPRDVAAYCAFLWHHGSHTDPRSPFCEKCGSAEACDCTKTAKASGSAPDGRAEWSLHDRVEFALRDAGFDYDLAFDIASKAAAAPPASAPEPLCAANRAICTFPSCGCSEDGPPASAPETSAPVKCERKQCGCSDPSFTDAFGALRFLSGRMKHAGIAAGVAQSYARDIDAILSASAPEVSADVTGSLERIRIAADNGGMNEGQCYSVWRTLTAALQQEGKSHVD